MKQEFKKGKWYRTVDGKEKWYIKVIGFEYKFGVLKAIHGEVLTPLSSGDFEHKFNDYWSNPEFIEKARPLRSISEIQEYLPDGHSDKRTDPMKEIQAEAKRRFPIGCRYIAANRGEYILQQDEVTYSIHSGNRIFAYNGGGLLYHDGEWAKRLDDKKQNNNMTKQKLIIPVTDVLQIHAVACSMWRDKIATTYLPRVDSSQNIGFTQKEVDEMFSAATAQQLPLLEKIFGKKVPQLETLQQMADALCGGELFYDDGDTTAMITLRVGGRFANKSFVLNDKFNWEIKEDSNGYTCLVPTPKTK